MVTSYVNQSNADKYPATKLQDFNP